MRRILIMLVFTTLLLTGCSKTPTDNLEGKTIEKKQKITSLKYENKQYRLKMDFPSNRTFKENVYWSTVMFFTPEEENKTTKENLWITIKIINSWANLNSLYAENKEILQWISNDFIIESEKDIKIDNYPAKQIQYAFSQEWYKIRQEQTLVIKWEILYMINYTATQDTFDNYKKDIYKIIESISIR